MHRLTTWTALVAVGVSLAACAKPSNNSDEAAIAAVAYRDAPRPALTLYTMVSNTNGSGGHSALRIDASESVIFDPAGSFENDLVPERDDVLFGISPRVERAYRSAHARSTYHVVSQTIPVTAAQAETAYRLALSNGRVADAMCANATSALLRGVPGLGEAIRTTFYPNNLREQVAALPGVETETYYEGDSANLDEGIARMNVALRQN